MENKQIERLNNRIHLNWNVYFKSHAHTVLKLWSICGKRAIRIIDRLELFYNNQIKVKNMINDQQDYWVL